MTLTAAPLPHPTVSAVIVNWNTRDMLAACLETLLASSGDVLDEVIVVDNGSEDGSPDLVRASFPEVRLVETGANLGFGTGANRGIRAARGAAVLVLNNDVLMPAGVVEALLRALESAEGAALVGCALRLPDGRPWAPPTPFPTVGSLVAANLRIGHRRPAAVVQAANHGEGIEVDWVPGACFLAWRSTLLEVGLFDEQFFLYYEDVDLCRRLRGAGHRVLFLPGVSATHDANHSTRAQPEAEPRALLEGFRSSLLYAHKHWGSSGARWVRLSIRLHALLRLAKCVLLALVAPSSRRSARRKMKTLPELFRI